MEGGERLNGHREVSPREPASELREYLGVLRARKLSILVVAGASLAVALFYSSRQSDLYTSTSRVLVNEIVIVNQVGAFKPNIDTERQVVESEAVAWLASDQLPDHPDAAELLAGVSVTSAPETEILNIHYTHPDPAEPQRRAQAFAVAYLDFRRQQLVQDQSGSVKAIQTSIDDLNAKLDTLNGRIAGTTDPLERTTLDSQSQVLVSRIAFLQQRLSDVISNEISVGRVVSTASPAFLTQTNHLWNGMVALFVGLVAGVGIAFLRERIDDRLRGRDDVAALAGAPVLGVIPNVPRWRRKTGSFLVTQMSPDSRAFESFRTLRANLLYAAGQEKVKTVMVTSARPGEGKTAVAANLAVVVAAAGKRVVLVSADLRRPRLHRFFGQEVDSGRVAVLAGPVNRLGMWEPNAEADLELALTSPSRDGHRELLPTFPAPTPAPAAVPAESTELTAEAAVAGAPGRRSRARRRMATAEWPAETRRSVFTRDELWLSDEMKERLHAWRDRADLVVIDTPPVLAQADASSLAPAIDAVLFVADGSRTSRESVRRAREQLDQVGAFVIGAVLNRSPG